MKKLLAILLALAMVMSLAACGSEPADDDKKDKDNKKEVVETTEEPTEEETTEPVTEENPEQICRGVINGDAYVNPYIGLKFTKPSEWTYSTDEEIAATLGIGLEALNAPDGYAELLEEMGSVYDMRVEDGDGISSVMVLIEKPNGIEAEAYLNMLVQGLEYQSAVSYTQIGEYETVSLGRNDYVKATFSATASGVTMQQAYYVCNVNEYTVTVISTVFGEVTLESVEAMFS